MLQWLIDLDKIMFEKIHTVTQSENLDFIMHWISNKYFWIPLYLLIVIFIVKNQPKDWKFWILGAILVFASTDLIAAKILKPYFERLRPCHNPDFTTWIHLPDGCGGKFGFVSNHASNTFGLTFFVWKAIDKTKWLQIILILYVILTAYSRIYLGAHYPGDIIFGWFLAFCIVKVVIFAKNKISTNSV